MLVSSLVPVVVLISSWFYKAGSLILEYGKDLFSYDPLADNGPTYIGLSLPPPRQ